MLIELLKPWGDLVNGGPVHPVGAVLEVPGGVGDMLITRGRAKLYKPPRSKRNAVRRAPVRRTPKPAEEPSNAERADAGNSTD